MNEIDHRFGFDDNSLEKSNAKNVKENLVRFTYNHIPLVKDIINKYTVEVKAQRKRMGRVS